MKLLKEFGTMALACFALSMPMLAHGQIDEINKEIAKRQKAKGDWQKLSYAGAGLGLLGLITHNNTLTYAGVAGGLYSLYRYDQDSKSQSASKRRRAAFYSRDHYTRNGKLYRRVVVNRNGHQYYQFVGAKR